MKKFFAVITTGMMLTMYSQSNNPTREDLLGTWEGQYNNQIFRINLFNSDNEYGELLIAGHFAFFSTDSNGQLIYSSDRPMDAATPQNWPPVINGGAYQDHSDSYKFSLIDNSQTSYLLRGMLYLKFINTPTSSPLKLSWNLKIDGMADSNEVFNLPNQIVLTKID